MKALKVAIIVMLFSLQVNATGFSHNMLMAQKVLKTRKVSQKAVIKPETLKLNGQTTVVKPATCPVSQSQPDENAVKPKSAATSFSQCIARWIVRVVGINGQVLEEKFVSLFSTEEDVEKDLPTNAHFLSVTDNIVSYVTATVRVLL
jgi:hypothetical protein